MINEKNFSFINNKGLLSEIFLFLSKKLKHNNQPKINLRKINKYRNASSILIDDYISTLNLLKLFLVLNFGKHKELIIYSYEMYFIHFNSISINGLNLSEIKNFIFCLVKCSLLSILITFIVKIIVCSELRKKLIKKI